MLRHSAGFGSIFLSYSEKELLKFQQVENERTTAWLHSIEESKSGKLKETRFA